jgi:hypothetical protein
MCYYGLSTRFGAGMILAARGAAEANGTGQVIDWPENLHIPILARFRP